MESGHLLYGIRYAMEFLVGVEGAVRRQVGRGSDGGGRTLVRRGGGKAREDLY